MTAENHQAFCNILKGKLCEHEVISKIQRRPLTLDDVSLWFRIRNHAEQKGTTKRKIPNSYIKKRKKHF